MGVEYKYELNRESDEIIQIGIKTDRHEIHLIPRRSIKSGELPRIFEALHIIFNNFKISEKPIRREMTKEDVFTYLDHADDMTRAILIYTAISGEICSDDLIEKLRRHFNDPSINSRKIGAKLAWITMNSDKHNREHFFEDYLQKKKDSEYKRYYRLKSKYAEYIKEWATLRGWRVK